MPFDGSFNRRELLRIGSISVFAGAAMAQGGHADPARTGRSCIFMLLQGGPSHLDLWDPKPDASVEIRGPFQTIATSMAGVRFGELMRGSARVADRLAIVRSMTHDFTNHIAGTYITLTGSRNQPNADREAHGDDFPGPGAILNHLETGAADVPRSISLPNWLSIPGPSNRMPGQYGGFLGGVSNPFLVEGDPNADNFRPLSLTLPEQFTARRMQSRLSLVQQLDNVARRAESELSQRYDHLRRSAFDLVVDGRVREAIELSKESTVVRDRYGRNKFGQSLLLARRLVEAGVQLVGFNEFNQKWDTHGGLAGRYKSIVPEMDQAFSTLVEDLDERGMLAHTMVINAGEFGRTPTMNKGAGRDHWPNAYSIALAGGGIRPGQVLGGSDNQGGEVTSHAVAPADVLATMWRQLGVAPKTIMHDRLKRPHMVSSGRVISELL